MEKFAISGLFLLDGISALNSLKRYGAANWVTEYGL